MMRKRGFVAGIGVLLVLSVLGLDAVHPSFGPRTASAQAPAAPASDGVPRDMVVARVGTQTITLGDLERRIRAVPPFALRRYGSTSQEIKKRFLDEVMVRELVLNQGALDQGLDKRPDVDDRLKGILRAALFESLKKEVAAEAVSDDEVKKFYSDNADKFMSPKRISIWRILVGSEPEAREIIAQMKGSDDIKVWNQLARDKSLDKASSMRSGNLGFVSPDGTTAQPELKLDVSLFDAADKVKDGEIVPDPVKEGDKWAVVWRRQGMRAVTRSLDSEASTIRSALTDDKMRKKVEALVASLRSANLSEIHPELCDMVTVTETGDIEKARRPGILPKAKQNAQPGVNDSPAGLR